MRAIQTAAVSSHTVCIMFIHNRHARGRVKLQRRKLLAHPSRNENITHENAPLLLHVPPLRPLLSSPRQTVLSSSHSASLCPTPVTRLALFTSLRPPALLLLSAYGCVSRPCARPSYIIWTGCGLLRMSMVIDKCVYFISIAIK